MLLEPVQGEGGVIPAPDTWLQRMRKITAEHGIPLIVDEVQTGVGRTGAFWAVEHSGVVPDVLVLSKAIGGSLPMAVVVYRDELDAWAPGAHAGTFRGNQLAMAAGAATLEHVRANDLAARAAQLGERMLARLRTLCSDHSCIGDVRGRGLMLGMELVKPDGEPDALGARPPAPKLAAAVRAEALSRGLIVEIGGRQGCVVRLLPPLTLTDEQCEAVLDRLADAVAAVERSYRAGQPELREQWSMRQRGRERLQGGIGVPEASSLRRANARPAAPPLAPVVGPPLTPAPFPVADSKGGAS
jgi:diaminobutyrate-2-oxoglutarate transaminase